MNWKHWLPMLVCCGAPLAIGAALSLGLVQLGDWSRWLLVLACPLGMGAMMWLMKREGAAQALCHSESETENKPVAPTATVENRATR